MSSTSFLAFAMLVVLITLSLSQPGKGAPTDADPERAAGPNYPSGREPVHTSWLRPEKGEPGPNYPNGKEPVHMSPLRPETGLAWPGPNYPNGKEPVHTSWLRPETGLAWPGPNYQNGKEPVHTSRLRPETGLAWPGPNYLNGKEPVHMSWNLPGNKLPSWSQPGNKLPSWSQPGKGEPADADPEWAGGEENPDCIKPCPRIRRYNRRICASNGKNYWNECTFEIAKCEAKLNGGNLTVKNEGPCSPGTPVCQKPCPKIANRPTCASNGKTYRSMCRFEIAQCKAKLNGVTITVKNNGPCNSKRPGLYDALIEGKVVEKNGAATILK